MQESHSHEHSNPPYQLVNSSGNNDGTLSAIVSSKSVRSLDMPLQKVAAPHEDEMLSWLHYPVNDSLDKGYCSDMFADLPSSSRLSFSQPGFKQQLQNASPLFHGMRPPTHGGFPPNVLSESTAGEAVESCGSGPAEASRGVAGADAVVAMGGGRATYFTSSYTGVGFLSKVDSSGGEVLSKIREPDPSDNAKAWRPGMDSVSSQHQAPFTDAGRSPFPVSKPLQQPMELYSSSLLAAKQTATNFSLFSRPAVQIKANLHIVGGSSGPTNEEIYSQPGTLQDPSAATPTSQLTSFGTAQGCGVPVGWSLSPLLLPPPLPYRSCSSAEYESNTVTLTKTSPPPPPPPNGCVSEAGGGMHVNKNTITDSKLPSGAVLLFEKGSETAEQTLTSPTQYSGSSTERSGKVTDSSIKTKRTGEDFDYQSEDTAVDKKSPAATKRSRTAEAHNMSEKKRRVKINDKLRTLQGLIPNGSKPDKASLLDAVIEYIKLLQSQLQSMSMRTGIGVPSWMIPNADMLHLQMPALPPMGFSMDMGMGLMDVGPVAIGRLGRALMPVTQFAGQPSAVHSSHAVGDPLQAPRMLNPHQLYLAHSYVQHPPAKMTMDQSVPMYNALIPPLQPQPQLLLKPQPQSAPPLPLQPPQAPQLANPQPLQQHPHHQCQPQEQQQ